MSILFFPVYDGAIAVFWEIRIPEIECVKNIFSYDGAIRFIRKINSLVQELNN